MDNSESYEQKASLYGQGTRRDTSVVTRPANHSLGLDLPLPSIHFPDQAEHNAPPKMPYIACHSWDQRTPSPFDHSYDHPYLTTWLQMNGGAHNEKVLDSPIVVGVNEPMMDLEPTLNTGKDFKASQEQWQAKNPFSGIYGRSPVNGYMHHKVPPLLHEDHRTSKQQLTDISSTPLSTPTLTNASYLSSSNSSVSGKSYKGRRSDRSKPPADKSSKLSSGPQKYRELDEHGFPTHFDNTAENPHLSSRERVRSYDSTTDYSDSPEPGALDTVSNWSQSASERSVISSKSSVAPSMDENNHSSNRQTENATEHSLQILTPGSSNATMFQGPSKFLATLEAKDVPWSYSSTPIVQTTSQVSTMQTKQSFEGSTAVFSNATKAGSRLKRHENLTGVSMQEQQIMSYTWPEKENSVHDSYPWMFWPPFDDPLRHYANDQYTFGNYPEALTDQSNPHEVKSNTYVYSDYNLVSVNDTENCSWPLDFPWANRSMLYSEPEVLNPPSQLKIPGAAQNSTPLAPVIMMDRAPPAHSDTKQEVGQSQQNILADKSTKISQMALSSQGSDARGQSNLDSTRTPHPQKRKQFQCIFCDVEYTTKNAWLRHETELHESPKKWQCPDCKATFLNESLFARHHKQNHSCHDCRHANEAKIELPRKTAWACGFCATVFQNWEKRCEHVSSHFVNDGYTKSDWNFSNVILGLLKQKWVQTAWQALLANHHGTNAEDQPRFQWDNTNSSCLELQQDLEHGLGEYEGTEKLEATPSRLEALVQTAYRLGTSENLSFSQDTPQVLPGDSESIANEKSSPQSQPKRGIREPTSSSDDDDNSSLDEHSDDDYDTDEEADGFRLPMISTTPPALEAISTLALGKKDFLARAMIPFQGPFIDTVVSEFLGTRFGPSPGIRSLAGSDQTNSSTASSGPTGGASSEHTGNGSSRKRGRGDEPPLERNSGKPNQDGNGDDPNKRRKVNLSTKSAESRKGKRYACPYYQRDPDVYNGKRSCIGPGWLEVHRVKDHLYKHHARPIQCHRCWQEFGNESSFAKHQNAEERCPQREERIALGFNKEQETLLRSKKRFNSIKNPDETWRHIYRILFPNDEKIPRPHFSTARDSLEPTADTPRSGAQVQLFEEYRKRALPALLKESLRKRLQSDSETESQEIRQTKANIESIINSIFPEVIADIFQRWNHLQEGQASSFPLLNDAQASAYTAVPQSQLPRHAMEDFYVAPPSVQPSNSLSYSDFNPLREEIQSSKPTSDSGYFSTGISSYGRLQEFSAGGGSQNHTFTPSSSSQSSNHQATSNSANINTSGFEQSVFDPERDAPKDPALQFGDSQTSQGTMLSPIRNTNEWSDYPFPEPTDNLSDMFGEGSFLDEFGFAPDP